MRLGQLARKLEVKPSEIAELLNAKHQLEISVHPNSKIPDEHIEEVKNHFYIEPVLEETPIIEKKPEEFKSDEKETVEDVVETALIEEPKADAQELPSEPESSIESNEDESLPESNEDEAEEKEPNSEVSEWENAEFITEETKSQADTIKVPKVDLEGLKVVGKIDLPEPKVEVAEEESSTETEADDAEAEVAPIKVSKPMRKQSKAKRPVKRKYTEKEKAEHLEKKKLDAHIELLKKQKEAKKKAHYAKTQEQKKKTAPVKKKKKKQNVNSDVPKKSKYKAKEAAPTGFWSKFKKWLNDS